MLIGGMQKNSLIDYPGKVSAALFTIGCNMRCGYCHNPELVLPERYANSMNLDEIFDFLEARKGKLDGIVISGGEPTMQPDLYDFIKTIKEMGYLVKLDTQGTNSKILKKLIEDKLIDFVAMDVKGPLDKYVMLAARPVDLDTILESISIIRDSGIDHEFRTTVVKEQINPSDFQKIGELVKGAKRFALQKFRPGNTVSPSFSRKTTYSDEEFEGFKEIMSKYVKECVVH